jgi:hypothetical protein
MNFIAIAGLGVSIATILLIFGISSQAKSVSFLEREEAINQLRTVSPNDLGISFKLVISPSGFRTGSIGAVDSTGTGPEEVQRALFISTRDDIIIHKILLCDRIGCIDNSFNGGGLGPGAINAKESEGEPDLYSFYNLDNVDWKEGDEIEAWAKVSKYTDYSYSWSEWVSLGNIKVSNCVDEFWCNV